MLELFFLFKGKISGIIGVGIGSLLHLFVLRGIVVGAFSLYFKVPFNEIICNSDLLKYVNLSSFGAQLFTLTGFIYLIPLKTVEKIMSNKSFYSGLLYLALFLNVYLVFRSYVYNIEFFSVNLAVQEMVLSLLVLIFFYIMLLLLIKIFNLGLYKEENKELKQQLDDDKALTAAMFSFSEIFIEANCTKDQVSRLLINSEQTKIHHLESLSDFLHQQSSKYTHPEDVEIIYNITANSLVTDFENGITEKKLDYRSKRIAFSGRGVSSVSDEYLWYRMQISIVRKEDCTDIFAYFSVDEIDKEKQMELELKKKAETDSLTGAYNKSTFAKKINELISNGVHGTLYMFDLDNFKGINDNMGHNQGDAVLKNVYDVLNRVFRTHDVIGRVGGDEFVVFLQGNTSKGTIVNKAEHLLKELNTVYHAQNGVDIHITTSIGMALTPRDATNFENLFNAADLSMYHSKSIGKNTYTIYDISLSKGYSPTSEFTYKR